jgi:CheY-like chemotaxis protein
MPPSAVVIGASDVLDALKASAGLSGEALAFADSQPLQALQAIADHRPPLVVLERLFAATSRGAALINRIKSDPALGQTEIRVLSHTGDYARVVSRPSPPASPEAPAASVASPQPVSASATVTETAAEPERPLDWHGTRRHPRYRARNGVEIQLDGTPATLIDVSVIGAQVVSPSVLRPNQRVRVTLPHEDGALRFRGAVAWAKFELPRNASGPQYRAGIEFNDADPAAVDAFCARVKS